MISTEQQFFTIHEDGKLTITSNTDNGKKKTVLDTTNLKFSEDYRTVTLYVASISDVQLLQLGVDKLVLGQTTDIAVSEMSLRVVNKHDLNTRVVESIDLEAYILSEATLTPKLDNNNGCWLEFKFEAFSGFEMYRIEGTEPEIPIEKE